MLSGPDRTRLLKMLALLSSDQGGERAAAGAAADRMLRDRGLTWPDLIQPVLGASESTRRASGTQSRGEPVERYAGTFTAIFDSYSKLSAWEREFARSAWSRSRLSDKQVKTLLDIAERVKTRGGPR